MSLAATRVLVVAVVTLSGTAALIYEAIWTRAFAIIAGSTVEAAATVFAAFLAGLALGARIGGAMVERVRNLIGAYALLEVGIAILGTAVGLLLFEYRGELPVLVGAPGEPMRVGRIMGLSLGLVLLPTLLMGATFPFVLELARRMSFARAWIGPIYAFNTLGGAFGALVCGFFSIRLVGVRWSCAVAAALNLIAAVLLMILWWRRRDALDPDAQWDPEQPLPLENLPSERALLSVAVLSGASVLALEVVWARFASYILGNRVHAVTTLLAWVLILLAGGSALSSRLLVRFGKDVRTLVTWLLVSAGLGVLVSTLSVLIWIDAQPMLERFLADAPGLILAVKVLGAGAVLAPMMLTLGSLFPLALTASRHSGGDVGATAGRYYLWNTFGSVAGSLGVGFVLIPAFGVMGCTVLVLVLIGLWALALGFPAARQSASRGARLALIAGLAVVLVPPMALPPTLSIVRPGDDLMFRKEDEHGILQITRTPRGYLRTTNNRTELIYHLGNPRTSYVQQMQGHLPMFYRPNARRTLVLGSGYGITAGALGTYPDVTVDAVEIVPGLIEAADLFEPYNLGYHRNPRVTIFVDDGRHFLERRQDRYDVVSVNVSDPLTQGQGGLFSRDFYTLVKSRMNPGGILVQHVFGIQTGTLFATLADSFEYVRMHRSYGNGYNVVASNSPLAVDVPAVSRLVAAPEVRAALEGIGLRYPLDPARTYAQSLGLDHVAGLMKGAPLCTDDFPVLEYTLGSARNLLFTNQ